MIITDLNLANINELESINRALNITFKINDGKIVGMEENTNGK